MGPRKREVSFKMTCGSLSVPRKMTPYSLHLFCSLNGIFQKPFRAATCPDISSSPLHQRMASLFRIRFVVARRKCKGETTSNVLAFHSGWSTMGKMCNFSSVWISTAMRPYAVIKVTGRPMMVDPPVVPAELNHLPPS